MFRLLVRAGAAGIAAGDIARSVEAPANTVSTQLAILTRAGLIRSRRESRSVIYTADYAAISALLGFVVTDCCQGRPEVCAPLSAITAGQACTSSKESRQ